MRVRRCRQSLCADSVCARCAFSAAPATQAFTDRAVCVLLSGRLPIEALVRLSVCQTHLLVCSVAFQSMCLGLHLTKDKLASWCPGAICHPGPLCLCLLSAAAALSFSALSREVTLINPSLTQKDFPCWQGRANALCGNKQRELHVTGNDNDDRPREKHRLAKVKKKSKKKSNCFRSEGMLAISRRKQVQQILLLSSRPSKTHIKCKLNRSKESEYLAVEKHVAHSPVGFNGPTVFKGGRHTRQLDLVAGGRGWLQGGGEGQ